MAKMSQYNYSYGDRYRNIKTNEAIDGHTFSNLPLSEQANYRRIKTASEIDEETKDYNPSDLGIDLSSLAGIDFNTDMASPASPSDGFSSGDGDFGGGGASGDF